MISKEKKSLSEKIISYIYSNNLRQGDALPSERKLAEIFQVSRNSVREALRKLEAQSILEIKPGSGCYVKTSDIDIFANPETDLGHMAFQHLEARLAFDPGIMQLAAERINKKEIVQLKNQVVRLSRNIMARNIESIINDDNSFRMILARATKNRVLILLAGQMEEYNAAIWKLAGDMTDLEFNKIFSTYVNILNFIKKRDAGGAKNEIRAQITLIFNYLRIILKDEKLCNTIPEQGYA